MVNNELHQALEEQAKTKVEVTMDKIVALAKSRGFVYQGSEIYGGLSNTWDYGPHGVELKNNVKRAWWKKFIHQNPYNVGMDAAILMNPRVWEASGHVTKATDPLMDCKECKERFRADKLVKQYLVENNINPEKNPDAWTEKELEDFISENKIKCPSCGKSNFTGIRQFNIMFKTFIGVTEDSKNTVYLRPETAQGIFVNFKNVQRTSRRKIPFGIGQIGKSFRNEITPGNFTFRTREFEQAELEFFCKPGNDLLWFNYWKDYCMKWLLDLGLKAENVRFYNQSKEELCHYSAATSDIEYKYPFGWDEVWGIADRTDYDLKTHMETSGEDMSYFDQETNEKYIPYCIEPAIGIDRVTLAFLCDAYDEEVVEDGDIRTVLRLHPYLAPIKIAIFPLSKKLAEGTQKVFEKMSELYHTEYDDTGSIGKRYRRQDEIGTPFCITYDFESENDNCVTIRHRDSMLQERINIDNLEEYFKERLEF